MALPPIPLKDIASLPYTLQEWLRKLRDLLNNNLINHNDLQSIQGGSSSERYHLTSAQQSLAEKILVTGLRPTDAAGVAQTVVAIFAGNGVPSNANGANGDFYFRGDGSAGTFVYHKAAGSWTAFI